MSPPSAGYGSVRPSATGRGVRRPSAILTGQSHETSAGRTRTKNYRAYSRMTRSNFERLRATPTPRRPARALAMKRGHRENRGPAAEGTSAGHSDFTGARSAVASFEGSHPEARPKAAVAVSTLGPVIVKAVGAVDILLAPRPVGLLMASQCDARPPVPTAPGNPGHPGNLLRPQRRRWGASGPAVRGLRAPGRRRRTRDVPAGSVALDGAGRCLSAFGGSQPVRERAEKISDVLGCAVGGARPSQYSPSEETLCLGPSADLLLVAVDHWLRARWAGASLARSWAAPAQSRNVMRAHWSRSWRAS